MVRVLGLDRALAGEWHQSRGAAGLFRSGRLHRRDHFAAHVEVDGEVVDRRAGYRDARATKAKPGWCGTVKKLADKAGIGMPEVAVYEGDANAFATGAFRNSALVAVSTGLLNSMSHEEIEAVLGHEIAHVANGDMVTLTLIQGVVNTFVVFLSRVVAFFVDRIVFRTERGTGPGLLHHHDRRADPARHPGEHDRRVVLAPTRVPRRRRQRAVPRLAAADDAARWRGWAACRRASCPSRSPASASPTSRRRSWRCSPRIRRSRSASARCRRMSAAPVDELIAMAATARAIKIEVEEGNGLWHDVRGADGAVLTFDDEAAARAKLAELYPDAGADGKIRRRQAHARVCASWSTRTTGPQRKSRRRLSAVRRCASTVRGCHMRGGTSPSLPTLTPPAVNVPSGCFAAPNMTCAPGTSIARSPGSKVTTGALGGTMMHFLAVLVLERQALRPDRRATTSATVALVIMLPGCRSQG